MSAAVSPMMVADYLSSLFFQVENNFPPLVKEFSHEGELCSMLFFTTSLFLLCLHININTLQTTVLRITN
jgi:hypothetical protein